MRMAAGKDRERDVTKYEYRVVPAPRKPHRIRGLKRGEDRFAASVAEILNELGAEGWEYQRSDTLPMDSRSGLTGHTTTFRTMLVFRRLVGAPDDDSETAPMAETASPPLPASAPATELAPESPLAPGAPTEAPTGDQPEISSARA